MLQNSLAQRVPSMGMMAPTARWMSDLPYHLVVGMPALSPTMEAGVISEWKVAEGESFVAGDSLAEIETDKATIDFEAQDDGVVAKILVDAGKGEIPVNQPILVTVEEEDDVEAFKDFVVESSAPEAEPEPESVVAAVADDTATADAAGRDYASMSAADKAYYSLLDAGALNSDK